MSEKQKLTYAASGVDYDAMDPFKRAATEAAAGTARNLVEYHGFKEVPWSRGESAYLIDIGSAYLAHVEEGLGTKNLVADAMWGRYGGEWYAAIAKDAVAMIVNDMATLGAMPLSVAMHLAVGHSDWFKAEERVKHLIDGWKKSCDLAECAWGGGETPTLRDIVEPGTAVISGSAMGIVKDKAKVMSPDKIRDGDAIIILEGTGIHANGLTMIRRDIAARTGYDARVGNGCSFGQALLEPTPIYVPFVRACLDAGIDLHYAVNVTGHGWRKLMRATQPFAYVIESVPTPQPVFDFIQKHGDVDEREMYGTFNMGAGFALYLPKDEVKKVWDVYYRYQSRDFSWGYGLVNAGRIEASDEKKVVIRPKGITFTGDELRVR